MPSSEFPTLLLRETPVHAGAQGLALLGDAARAASARCRLYVLADLAAAPGSPPLGAALVEIEPSGRSAVLVAAAVVLPNPELRARLVGDLLTELRAEGVRTVRYRGELEPGGAGYDLPDIAWLEREL